MLPSPRSFDGGIQRQQVGLSGNRLDGGDYAADLLSALTQRSHPLGVLLGLLAALANALHGHPHHLHATQGRLLRRLGVAGRHLTVVGNIGGGGHHLLAGGCHRDRLGYHLLGGGGDVVG